MLRAFVCHVCVVDLLGAWISFGKLDGVGTKEIKGISIIDIPLISCEPIYRSCCLGWPQVFHSYCFFVLTKLFACSFELFRPVGPTQKMF